MLKSEDLTLLVRKGSLQNRALVETNVDACAASPHITNDRSRRGTYQEKVPGDFKYSHFARQIPVQQSSQIPEQKQD